MAKELSQAALLDFLCQAGGRVPNAALLGHFQRFLRDPAAPGEELQRRRHLFKGFVNSVASVKQEGPGAPKEVVLRRRYRELVGEEPRSPDNDAPEAARLSPGGAAPAPAPAPQPPALDLPPARAPPPQGPSEAGGSPRAHGGRGGECPGKRAEDQAQRARSRTCPSPAVQDLRARLEPRGELGGPPGAPLPANPAPSAPPAPCARPGAEPRGHKSATACPPEDLQALPAGAPRSNRPPFPGGATGGFQQRVGAWVASSALGTAPQADCALIAGEEPWPSRPSPPGSCPSPPLQPQPGRPEPPGLELWREPLPVFRSIRCQLSLQDLDEFLEQESPASEYSSSSRSSSSGDSDSCRGEREIWALQPPPAPQGPNGWVPNLLGVGWTKAEEGLPCKAQANGLVGPSTRAVGPPLGAPIPGHLALLGQITRGSSPEDELLEKDSQRPSGRSPKLKKVTRLPPPNLDAPLLPLLAPRQGHPNSTPAVEEPSLDRDGSPEHRSSLVPLEPREHTWLVKVAMGSWLQVRALFLEDPHLATRKDFISGYTVLHWLAKHGNAQVLQDFIAGARRAGVALDVNVKSGCGYTPLHLAAMHGHHLVIRLLVQKLQCRVEVRDSSGRKPWQYLSSSTSGEIWQLLGAPKGKTIFPAHPIARNASLAQRRKSPELGRKISRKTSLAAYLKPQHIKWKMANKYPALQEREEYSD